MAEKRDLFLRLAQAGEDRASVSADRRLSCSGTSVENRKEHYATLLPTVLPKKSSSLKVNSLGR